MGSLSLGHWIVVLLIVVLFFGTSKLRNLGKDLGGAVHDFKKGLNEGSEEAASKQAGKQEDDKQA
ncbi:MAG: Sec-independent protein translocase subunit TatA [Neisseria sp.]|nr:Sec-independent protein translocase subunit TatA [Neisseria sp.]